MTFSLFTHVDSDRKEGFCFILSLRKQATCCHLFSILVCSNYTVYENIITKNRFLIILIPVKN